VDLRGRLSNPEAVETMALATQAMAGVKIHHGSTASRPVAHRRWRLVDRLGEQIISDLLRDREMGATQRTLAERYSISLSSVKGLTRRPRSDSFEPTIRWEAGRTTRKVGPTRDEDLENGPVGQRRLCRCACGQRVTRSPSSST
jgi:hypothetical protein